jgi:uncharacterized membrane protein YfcA
MIEGLWLYFWLGLSAFAAAVVNSVAGGGTLLTFPALLVAVSPVVANGTSTVALVSGSLAAAWGYRQELQPLRRWLIILAIPSLAGGIVGSLLVTQLDEHYFDVMIPWLILAATFLFLFQPLLVRRATLSTPHSIKPWTVAWVVFFQFLVSVYGGYFGAGIGILMLSSLGIMGVNDIHAMNALKNILAAIINGVSICVFIINDAVDWRYASVMAPLAIVGAYACSRVARHLNRQVVRVMVIAIGFILAGQFFLRRWSGGE